jgi:hypothetical protein
MREEAVNCRRKCASATAICETPVAAMNSSASRRACTCICDGGVTADVGVREREVNRDETRIPRIGSLPDPAENGNTLAPQRKIFNINEGLHRQVPRCGDTNMNVSGDAVCPCPVICIDSTRESRPSVTVNSDLLPRAEEGDIAVIRLSLRKPRHWKWKLTTCASAPSVILLDERGDLLMDTGKRSGTHVDRNGNDTDVQSGNDVSGLTQGIICPEHREYDHVNNRKATKGVVKVSEQMFPQRCDPVEAVEKRRTGGKSRKVQSVDTNVRSMSKHKVWPGCCESNGSVKVCHWSRSKVQQRRVAERRRNRADSSTSGESSPEGRRRTARRDRATGRTVFCAGTAKRFVCVRVL